MEETGAVTLQWVQNCALCDQIFGGIGIIDTVAWTRHQPWSTPIGYYSEPSQVNFIVRGNVSQ